MWTKMFRTRTIALTLWLVLCVHTCYTAGQTANTVNDTTGSIVWGELAPDKPYKTVSYTADDGGLDPYYALAVSFIDSSLPEELPVGTVKDILDGKASIGDKWQDLAKDFVGYALSIVIGFLFILIFPIVGCCFCCCRCCGKCGGKRLQKQRPNDKCKRIGFGIAVTILSLFVIAGAGCAFVSSDQFHKNLDGLNSSVTDAVDDLHTFVDNVDNQFTRLGDTNFRFLSQVLQNYVGNASSQVSEDLISAINDMVNLDARLDTIKQLSDQSLVLVDQLSAKTTTLETQRDTAKTQLQNAACPTPGCLAAEILFLDNMDLTEMKNQTATFKEQVSTDVFSEMKNKMDSAIAASINDSTKNIDVSQQLDDIYNNQIKSMLDQMDTLKDTVNNDTAKYQKDVDKYTDKAKPFDKYRWYGGLGLACLLVLIALLMMLGVFLGCCCGSVSDRPTERGSASNCGGICLMAAVGLIFIFGPLLMLLTTPTYMVGALTERYVCQSVDNPERLENYAGSLDIGPDLQNMTFNLNGETIGVSVSKLLEGCQNGETLYTVLGLKSVVDTALGKIEDYKKDLNIADKINATDAAGDAVGKVNVSDATDQLKSTVTSIDAVKTTITNLKGNLTVQKNNAEAKVTGTGAYYDPMLTTLGEMETITDSLKTTAQSIVNETNLLTSEELPEAEARLNNKTRMADLIHNITQGFVNKIFGFVDSYVGDIRTKLSTDVGKCTPFYSIVNAVLGEAFCHGIVDPLNGFWLALGWSIFFFLPSMILSVKLAKHFRTMLYEDSYDSTIKAESPPPAYTKGPTIGTPPKSSIFPPINGPNNKVAPF